MYDIKGWDSQLEQYVEIHKLLISSDDKAIDNLDKSLFFYMENNFNVWNNEIEYNYYTLMNFPKRNINLKLNDMINPKFSNIAFEIYTSRQYITKMRIDFLQTFLNVKNEIKMVQIAKSVDTNVDKTKAIEIGYYNAKRIRFETIYNNKLCFMSKMHFVNQIEVYERILYGYPVPNNVTIGHIIRNKNKYGFSSDNNSIVFRFFDKISNCIKGSYNNKKYYKIGQFYSTNYNGGGEGVEKDTFDKDYANRLIRTYDVSTIIKSSSFNNYVMNLNHGGSDCVMQIYKEKWMSDLINVKFDDGQTIINYASHLATDIDTSYLNDAYYEYVYEGKYSSVSFSSRLNKYGAAALVYMNEEKACYNAKKSTNMSFILHKYLIDLGKTNEIYSILSKVFTYYGSNTSYLGNQVF